MKISHHIGLLTTVCFCGALITPPVCAEGDGRWWHGFYLGAGAGLSDFRDADDTRGDIDNALSDGVFFTNFSTNVDDDDTGWKVFGGYQFNPHLGIELSYADFGKAQFDTNFTAELPVGLPGFPLTARIPGQAKFEYEAEAIGLAATGTLPFPESWGFLKRFGVFGKLGGFYWDAELQAKIDAPGVLITAFPFTEKEDASGFDVMFGLGAKFAVTRNIGVRVEWERYNDVGDEDKTGETDIDLFSGAVVYNF